MKRKSAKSVARRPAKRRPAKRQAAKRRPAAKKSVRSAVRSRDVSAKRAARRAKPARPRRPAKRKAAAKKRPILTNETPSGLLTELPNEQVPVNDSTDGEAVGSLSRDPSDPPADRGHQAPTFEGDDEQRVAERLVTEGVEEAENDQIAAARRLRQPE